MSEQSEGSEIQEPPYIELDAPEYLAEGQNIFDQSPFSGILQDVATKTQLNLEVVRNLLGIIIKFRNTQYPPEPMFVESSAELIGKMRDNHSYFYLEFVNRGQRHGKREDIRAAIAGLASGLEVHRYWKEYLDQFLHSIPYRRNDGSYQSRDSYFSPTKTYANFAANKPQEDERDKAIGQAGISIGIEEVFPQDFSGRTQAFPDFESLRPTDFPGKKMGNRRWRILKASGIVGPK